MKTKLVVQDVYSDSVDLRGWWPENIEDISLRICVEVGEKNEIGSNNFYFTLSSPEALKKKESSEYFLVKNRTIIVGYFDYKLLYAGVEKIVAECCGESFEESCLQLTRYFDWEYEDFR
ncbi:MAG: hypothetical protein EOO88_53955 [Pedobacter sp.]|nr:MAG: hypothetical protein EOO88_53955 [Pedobacter sp.]